MSEKELLQQLNNKMDVLLTLLQNGALSVSAPVPTVHECKHTLYKWLDEWFSLHKVGKSPNTVAAIEVSIRVHIKKILADVPLNSLEGIELQRALMTIEGSRARKSTFDVLNMALKAAVNIRLIKNNPLQGVQIPVHHRVNGTPLSSREVGAFLKKIANHETENYFKFLLYTGCRRTEGLNVKKSDIDTKKGTLHIRGSKTKTSDRVIPLFEQTIGLMASQKNQKDGILFPFRPDYVTRLFKRFCPKHKLHDLRHTFATQCLIAKIPLIVVQKWLGHSEIDTTADIYAHVTQEVHKDEAARLNAYHAQKGKKKGT